MAVERETVVEQLLGGVRCDNARIDELRQEISDVAHRKAEKIVQLRSWGLSVIEIADRLGIKRQAVYDALNNLQVGTKTGPVEEALDGYLKLECGHNADPKCFAWGTVPGQLVVCPTDHRSVLVVGIWGEE